MMVFERVRLAQREPERKGRLSVLRQMMAEADALIGAQPGPGTPELGPVGTSAFHHALAAFYRRHGRLDPTIEACEAGVALDPHDVVLRRLWLETLNSAGRLKEAGPVLDLPKGIGRGPVATAAEELLKRAEKLLLREGEDELALDAIEQTALLGPVNGEGLRKLMRRAEAIDGGKARLAAYRERIRAGWSARLPARLADGLAALKRRAPPIEPPQAALSWAWALADRDQWSREEWRREIDWGERAAGLMLKWWSVRPDHKHEIAELVDAPDLAPVREAHAAGRPQVIVGAHVGPTLGAFHLFETSGLPFRTLGGTALVELSGEQGVHIGMANRTSVSRELVQSIRRSDVLSITADTPTDRDRIEMDFLGRKVAIKSLPATLAQRYGCDTWWCQSLWRGDRIVVELQRLPAPQPDEPPADWAQRWGRAYLKRLKPTMRGDPRNLTLGAGIWRFASSTLQHEGGVAGEMAGELDGHVG